MVLEVTREQRPTEGMASAEALKREELHALREGRGRSVALGACGPGQESELCSESVWEQV